MPVFLLMLGLLSTDTMHLCGGPGPLCPPPPCHMIGPGHHPPPHWHCTQVSSSTSSEDTTSVDTSYYEYKEDDGDSSGSSASGSSGFMWFNALMYLVGAAALASIVGFIVFKKRVSLRILVEFIRNHTSTQLCLG